MTFFPRLASIFAAALVTPLTAAPWNGHGGDPQHSAIAAGPSQPFATVRWTTPVDDSEPSEPILIHYGSPIITQANTVVVPVRAADSSFRLEAHSGINGSLLWSTPTDFVTAPSTVAGCRVFHPR